MSEADKADKFNAKQRDNAKKDELVQKDAIVGLMSHERGRRYVWLELEAAHIFQSSYSPGSFDLTAFREGERNSGLRLLALVNKFAPAQYVLMTKENSSVKLEEETEDE